MAPLFASISAGISALWGPLHGGANQKVIEMLMTIAGGERTAREFMDLAKDKHSGVRLMGFGHRVYKNYDPRAKVLMKNCHEVLDALGIKHEPLLEIALLAGTEFAVNEHELGAGLGREHGKLLRLTRA